MKRGLNSSTGAVTTNQELFVVTSRVDHLMPSRHVPKVQEESAYPIWRSWRMRAG